MAKSRPPDWPYGAAVRTRYAWNALFAFCASPKEPQHPRALGFVARGRREKAIPADRDDSRPVRAGKNKNENPAGSKGLT
jgi:hypothetical protein